MKKINKKRYLFLFIVSLFLFNGCFLSSIILCNDGDSLTVISKRNFLMGFSTWSFGPDSEDREETYFFIADNSDIYSEQIDYKIPWDAWINNTDLPKEFTDNIDFRLEHRFADKKLLLSVSLLNVNRDNLMEDYDGSIPDYTSLSDKTIEDAYFKHLEYLIDLFNPDYLIVAMEVNLLKIRDSNKWEEYKVLISNIKERLKEQYPDLPLSESITLQDWMNPDLQDSIGYVEEIKEYVNQNMDFASISFYPFFIGEHTKEQFQSAFDFLHDKVSIPVSFAETAHLAEDLVISEYNIKIDSDPCEQKDYLETLLLNAYNYDYLFVIWWAYRDYDELWEIFPEEISGITKLWRDTGLFDENGNQRPAYDAWKEILSK